MEGPRISFSSAAHRTDSFSPEENRGTADHQFLFKLRIPDRPDVNRMGILRQRFKDVFEVVRGQIGTFQQSPYFPRRHSQLVERARMGDDEVGGCAILRKPGRKLFFKELGQRIVVIAGELLAPETFQQGGDSSAGAKKGGKNPSRLSISALS